MLQNLSFSFSGGTSLALDWQQSWFPGGILSTDSRTPSWPLLVGHFSQDADHGPFTASYSQSVFAPRYRCLLLTWSGARLSQETSPFPLAG